MIKKLPIQVYLLIFLAIIVLISAMKGNFFWVVLALIIIINSYKKIKPNLEKFGLNFDLKNQRKKIINMENFNQLPQVGKIKKMALIIIGIIFLLWLFFSSIIIVEAGETGVYSLFGKVKDSELKSGFHLVIPLAKVIPMSVRTEEYTMSIAQGEGKKYAADAITALTKEGLSVDLDITVLYRLDEEKASDVYKTVGLDYEEKIIRPAIRTAIRDVIAQYEAKDIYSEKRSEASSKISEELRGVSESRGILIEEVLLRNINLPANLANSIQEKLQAEQEAQKYEFLLQTEKKEKERKIIEAEGQRDAQKIINESLSSNYLYYLYINQLKDRQGTIYVPTSPSSGMPLFNNIGK